MFLQKILLSLTLSLTSLSFVQCAENPFQSSKLPKEMPAGGVEIGFNSNGGMLRSYTRIQISDDVLTFEELKGNEQKPHKWTARISREDLEKLYQVFVTNKFDLIQNDKRQGIVYDAGSEGVSISFANASFSKTYGKNSPMSGSSLKRYQEVSGAIESIAAAYANKGQTVSEKNYAVLDYDPQSYTWVFKNAKAADLTESEIKLLEDLLKKAVDEHNSKAKAERGNLELAEYKRQYVPVINENGEKEVWVNCFCNDSDRDWQNRIVMVKDGGKCYFNLKINLTTKKYSDFMVNGNA